MVATFDLSPFRVVTEFSGVAKGHVAAIMLSAQTQDFCPSYIDFITPAIGRFGLSQSDAWRLPPNYDLPHDQVYGHGVIAANATDGPFSSLRWINLAKVIADNPPVEGQTHIEVVVSFQGGWRKVVEGRLRAESYRNQGILDMQAHYDELNTLEIWREWVDTPAAFRTMAYRRDGYLGLVGENEAGATFPDNDTTTWGKLRIRFPLEPDPDIGDKPVFEFL